MVSRRLIDELFTAPGNHSVAVFPLRAVYKYKERAKDASCVQLLISVPKKHFKHAVDRNRVKRQVREAYRLHKAILYAAIPADRQLLLSFVWLSDRHLPTFKVETTVLSLLQRIAERL